MTIHWMLSTSMPAAHVVAIVLCAFAVIGFGLVLENLVGD